MEGLAWAWAYQCCVFREAKYTAPFFADVVCDLFKVAQCQGLAGQPGRGELLFTYAHTGYPLHAIFSTSPWHDPIKVIKLTGHYALLLMGLGATVKTLRSIFTVAILKLLFRGRPMSNLLAESEIPISTSRKCFVVIICLYRAVWAQTTRPKQTTDDGNDKHQHSANTDSRLASHESLKGLIIYAQINQLLVMCCAVNALPDLCEHCRNITIVFITFLLSNQVTVDLWFFTN